MTDPLRPSLNYRFAGSNPAFAVTSSANPSFNNSAGLVNTAFSLDRSLDNLTNLGASKDPIVHLDCSQMTEEQYRNYLDRTFKPMFMPYENTGGIPCQHILRMFQYKEYGLPKMRRDELLLKMDSNKDGIISYKEFKSCLINVRYRDLNPFKRVGLCAILAANPGMRLREAKTKVRRRLGQKMIKGYNLSDNVDSMHPGIAADPITGGYKYPGGKFYLEPDGVWPTSRKVHGLCPGDVWDHTGPRILISDEVYVPQSYLNAYNCKPPPLFIPTIVIVQIAVFIFYAVQLNSNPAETFNHVTWTTGWPINSPLYYTPTRRREAWRYITYMFIHSGYEHIILNSFAALVLGILIEWVNKFWRVAPVYLAGVFLGCLGHSVLEPNTILVGASGGVYALIGAHLALVIMNWEEMQHDWTNIRNNPFAFISNGITRLILILAFLGFDFSFALYRRFGVPDIHTISFMAHVFGFFAGLLIGIPVLKNIQEKPWERILFWVCLVIYIILVIVGILFNILWPGYLPAEV